MAEVTITIPNSNWAVGNNFVNWEPPNNSRISLGTSLAATGGQELFFAFLFLPRNNGTNLQIRLARTQTEVSTNAGPDFSDQMETSGHFTFIASNGASLTVTGGINEPSPPDNDPYNWPAPDVAAVRAFTDILAGLADRSLTVTFNDGANQPPVISNLTAVPMSVAAGEDVALSATVTDPNMDMLAYSWSANPDVGSFSDASALNTTWTAHSPLIDQAVMLTLTADDGEDNSSASVSVTVGGRLTPSPVNSPYVILVDVNEDDGYGADIYPRASQLQFEAGASGARRRSIDAVAGTFGCLLNNSDNLYTVPDLEDKPVLVRRDGIYLWGGRIVDVEDMSEKGTRRELKISAHGIMRRIGGSVPADVSRPGDIPASEAISLLTGETILDPSPQEVTNWSIEAGDSILPELRSIQDSSGTRVYEDGIGGIQVAGQGIAELWDFTIADDQPASGDRLSRRFRKGKPTSGIINAAVIDGTKYTDSDSVDEYGEVLHPSDFEFAVSTNAATIAANQFSLYAQPADIFTVSILLEQLADAADLNDILEELHYGNERLLRVRQKGVVSFVEIMKVRHSVMRGERHIITLELRERATAGLNLNLCTYHDREVGYFATLPQLSMDGLRAITGHKIQFRETGTTDWTDAVSSETGSVVNDTFTVPTADIEYDVRLVATSVTGDEQISPTQTFKALAGDIQYGPGFSSGIRLGVPLADFTWRSYRIYTDEILETSSTGMRILGFDFHARENALPAGYISSLYLPVRSYARPFGQPGTPQASVAANNYAVPQQGQNFDYVNSLLIPGPFGGSYQFQQPVEYAVPNPNTRTQAQLRFRPIFHAAGATLATGERGLWTPWLDSINDITTQY